MRSFLVAVCVVLAGSAPALAWAPFGYEIVEISSGAFYHDWPRLNNCGEIAFSIRLGSSWASSEIFLYDNGLLVQITENSDRDVAPDINDQGTIVCTRGIGDGAAKQIIHYENGEATLLAEGFNGWAARGPSINNLGHVAWQLRCSTDPWL